MEYRTLQTALNELSENGGGSYTAYANAVADILTVPSNVKLTIIGTLSTVSITNNGTLIIDGDANAESSITITNSTDTASVTATVATTDGLSSMLSLSGITEIQLTGSITTENTLTLSSDYTMTLDLNNYTIDVGSYGFSVCGSLTIKDSGTSGTITGSVSDGSTMDSTGGVITVNSGSILGTAFNNTAIAAFDGGKVVVNGGTLTGSNGGAALAGNNLKGTMTFEVNGGTLNADSGPAVYMPGPISLTVTGGTINGGIGARMGIITISGGTINATTGSIDAIEDYYNYSGNVWLADAIFVMAGTYTSKYENYTNELNLTMTGGTINCSNGKGSAVAIYDMGLVAQTMSVTITNGTFTNSGSSVSTYRAVKIGDIVTLDEGSKYGTVSNTITQDVLSSLLSN